MSPAFRPIASVVAVLALSACNDSIAPITALPHPLTSSEQGLVVASNQFTFRLLQAVNDSNQGKNVFISPLSVSMALGMATNGAAGPTRDSMLQTLGLSASTIGQADTAFHDLIPMLTGLDPNVQVQVANSVWYRQGFSILPSFLEVTRQSFDADVTALDFSAPSAPATINSWVADKTHGKIDEIVDAIPPKRVLYLINAVYFKGSWTHPFDPAITAPGAFTLEDASTRQVPMMHQDKAPLWHYDDSSVEALDLPYGGGAFRMTVVLPAPGKSVNNLVATLDATRWATIVAGLDSTQAGLGLPKFTMTFFDSLNDPLKRLGMAIAFGDGIQPDFGNLSTEPIVISQVLHKTFVAVDEMGTEAAAVTSVAADRTTGGTSILVNRPFVFAIRERYSGAILFIGKVLDPTS